MEHEPPDHQPRAFSSATSLGPSRPPFAPLSVLAPLLGLAATAERLLRHVFPGVLSGLVVQGHGPATARAAARECGSRSGQRRSARPREALRAARATRQIGPRCCALKRWSIRPRSNALVLGDAQD